MIAWTDELSDAAAAKRSTAIRPFPTKFSYWWAEKKGELRLKLRAWLGIEDVEAALTAVEAKGDNRAREQGSYAAAIRTDLDADQSEYATERAADLERLSTLETNVQKVATQNAQISAGLNGVTLLALAWREVPILKAAEKKAQAQLERTRADKAERQAVAHVQETVAEAGQHFVDANRPEPEPA